MPIGAAAVAFLGVTGTTAAAVVSSVAIGIVTGAVIGAATSLVTGGNIFEGALMGAALGGLTAGIATGISIGVSGASAGAAGAGAAAPSAALPTAGPSITGGMPMGGYAGTAASAPSTSILGGASTFNIRPDLVPAAGTPATPPVPTDSSLLYSELGKGLAKGVGDVASAKIKATSDKEIAEQAKADADAKIAGNVPGTFEAKTANIKMPNWWEKYTAQAASIERYKPPTGLLGGAR